MLFFCCVQSLIVAGGLALVSEGGVDIPAMDSTGSGRDVLLACAAALEASAASAHKQSSVAGTTSSGLQHSWACPNSIQLTSIVCPSPSHYVPWTIADPTTAATGAASLEASSVAEASTEEASHGDAMAMTTVHGDAAGSDAVSVSSSKGVHGAPVAELFFAATAGAASEPRRRMRADTLDSVPELGGSDDEDGSAATAALAAAAAAVAAGRSRAPDAKTKFAAFQFRQAALVAMQRPKRLVEETFNQLKQREEQPLALYGLQLAALARDPDRVQTMRDRPQLDLQRTAVTQGRDPVRCALKPYFTSSGSGFVLKPTFSRTLVAEPYKTAAQQEQMQQLQQRLEREEAAAAATDETTAADTTAENDDGAGKAVAPGVGTSESAQPNWTEDAMLQANLAQSLKSYVGKRRNSQADRAGLELDAEAELGTEQAGGANAADDADHDAGNNFAEGDDELHPLPGPSAHASAGFDASSTAGEEHSVDLGDESWQLARQSSSETVQSLELDNPGASRPRINSRKRRASSAASVASVQVPGSMMAAESSLGLHRASITSSSKQRVLYSVACKHIKPAGTGSGKIVVLRSGWLHWESDRKQSDSDGSPADSQPDTLGQAGSKHRSWHVSALQAAVACKFLSRRVCLELYFTSPVSSTATPILLQFETPVRCRHCVQMHTHVSISSAVRLQSASARLVSSHTNTRTGRPTESTSYACDIPVAPLINSGHCFHVCFVHRGN